MKSMTGFGRGEAQAGDLAYRVELSSVNRKQTDIVVGLPRELAPLEPKIRERVAGVVSRGRVNVNINVGTAEGAHGSVQVDEDLAKQYLSALKSIHAKLHLDGPEETFDPMRAPGVVTLGESLPEPDEAWAPLAEALQSALDDLVAMRAAEGAHLREDMLAKLGRLQDHVDAIEKLAPGVAERYRENLHKRLAAGGLDLDLDDERVLREVGLFAERCDISEEITRLESHFIQCAKYIESGDPVGRSLDFLAQEMNRELNTIGSKANDATIAQHVVEAKTELEKIREQVQNVE